MKVRLKTVLEGTRWYSFGDHSEVEKWSSSSERCEKCKKPMTLHGRIGDEWENFCVCPGDWLIEKDREIIVVDNFTFKTEFEEIK